MGRPSLDNRLFLIGFCITACGTETPEGNPFTTGSTDNDDDDESTSTGDPSPTVSASASASGSASATSPSTTVGETDSTTTGPDETTMMIDPTTGESDPSTTNLPETSTSSGTPETGSSSSGTPETSGTTTTDGMTTSTGTGGGAVGCGPYATAYEVCYDYMGYGYENGYYYCMLYAGDCIGISDECDVLFNEWVDCQMLLECGSWEFPPCPDELDELQTTCACGN